jgi:very-short-patch-repair endonuclease
MNFKPLPDLKTKKRKAKKAKVHLLSDKVVNEYLKNRKLKKLSIIDNRVIITLVDDRKVIIEITDKGHTLKVKRSKECMSENELASFNYNVDKALKRTLRGIPNECKQCMDAVSN